MAAARRTNRGRFWVMTFTVASPSRFSSSCANSKSSVPNAEIIEDIAGTMRSIKLPKLRLVLDYEGEAHALTTDELRGV
jgi:hypothetical protein